jgi:hypothetical protein
MPRSENPLLTVSPQSFDRTAFAALDRALATGHAPYRRDWVMAGFAEGLEIRMLRDPLCGFVMFQPGALCWRPIEGAAQAIVVHDLRIDPEHDLTEGRDLLWSAVEEFALYYGYAAVLAATGTAPGLIAPRVAANRHWVTLDHGPGDARLIGRILQGPLRLPAFPRDWTRRAAACGPGLVLQSTGENTRVEAHLDRVEAVLRARGVPIRRDLLSTPEAARHRAATPGALCSVILDGTRLGGTELTGPDILHAVQRRRRPA